MATLPVKVSLRERGVLVAWSVDCYVWKTPEIIDQVFIHSWDALLLWDDIKITLIKELYIPPHRINFLPVPSNEFLAFMFILVGLYYNWRSRMEARHADPNQTPVHLFYINCLTQIKANIEAQTLASVCASILEDELSTRWTV